MSPARAPLAWAQTGLALHIKAPGSNLDAFVLHLCVCVEPGAEVVSPVVKPAITPSRTNLSTATAQPVVRFSAGAVPVRTSAG